MSDLEIVVPVLVYEAYVEQPTVVCFGTRVADGPPLVKIGVDVQGQSVTVVSDQLSSAREVIESVIAKDQFELVLRRVKR